MKALLMKDAYVLWKQMRTVILILVAISLVGGTFNSVFLVVWCSMLPYTAISYDERSHWGQLAAMMPYSLRDLVLSKYVLGWLCMAGAVALSTAVQATAVLAGREGPDLALLLTSLLAGVVALDITLPMIFRFGAEKGRLMLMVAIFGAAILGGSLAGAVEDAGRVPALLVAGSPVIAAAATVISVPMSMKLYQAE